MSAYIKLKDVSVEFPIYNASNRSIKNKVLNAATGGKLAASSGNKVLIKSLSNINLEINEGDRIGLYGHNGAGKTTLLRLLSGSYSPTGGEIDVQGKVVSMLSIGVGMDGEFTGYENIMLRGALLGYTSKQVSERADQIAEFCELGEYLNVPVRTYSSGMNMRLAFSIVTSFPADIILMDEWLSVGDESFQKKASSRLQSVLEDTAILVIASHSKQTLYKTCNKIITLEHGEIKAIEEVTEEQKAEAKG